MQKKIFEYAILLHPTEDEDKAGKSSVLLVPTKQILADSVGNATILASREIPAEHIEHLDRVEVAVRPF